MEPFDSLTPFYPPLTEEEEYHSVPFTWFHPPRGVEPLETMDHLNISGYDLRGLDRPYWVVKHSFSCWIDKNLQQWVYMPRGALSAGLPFPNIFKMVIEPNQIFGQIAIVYGHLLETRTVYRAGFPEQISVQEVHQAASVLMKALGMRWMQRWALLLIGRLYSASYKPLSLHQKILRFKVQQSIMRDLGSYVEPDEMLRHAALQMQENYAFDWSQVSIADPTKIVGAKEYVTPVEDRKDK